MGEISVQHGLHSSRERVPEVIQQLLECSCGVTVDLSTQHENQMKPRIHLQSNVGPFQIATLLLYHGATLKPQQKNGGEPKRRSGLDIEGEYYIRDSDST